MIFFTIWLTTTFKPSALSGLEFVLKRFANLYSWMVGRVLNGRRGLYFQYWLTLLVSAVSSIVVVVFPWCRLSISRCMDAGALSLPLSLSIDHSPTWASSSVTALLPPHALCTLQDVICCHNRQLWPYSATLIYQTLLTTLFALFYACLCSYEFFSLWPIWTGIMITVFWTPIG